MTSRSRPPRRQSPRTRQRSASGRWAVPLLGAAVVALAAGIALALSGSPSATPGSTVPPSQAAVPSAAPGGSASGVDAATPPVISGDPLPRFESPVGDPAIGMPAPAVDGSSFDGSATAIAPGARPTVVIFLAHWCSHCQAEVPVLQAWVNAGGLPAGIDFVSVATAIDPGRPNYPPDAWLTREGWTVPVIVDPTDAVAEAYGLSAFPFWTFIGADGTVRARATGQLDIQQLSAVIGGLTGS